MAPKRQAASASAAAPATTTSSPPATTTTAAVALSPKAAPQEIIQHIWQRYLAQTPQRTFLLDAFMAFLVLVGGFQFVYCVVAGNYPFNAFLSGFSAAVGQFVLTASLRMQTSPQPSTTSKSATAKGKVSTTTPTGEEQEISHERAFADYIFGSLILHFFCINFMN